MLTGKLRWLPLAFCLLCVPAYGQEAKLEAGKPVEREIAGGEAHAYQIKLSAGQFVRATLDQIGRDMVLALEGPNGKKILEVDLYRPSQPETIAFVPVMNGDHRIVVRAKGIPTVQGTYVLRLFLRPQATTEDRERIAFETLTREAALSIAPVTAQQALDKAKQALAFWRQTGERFWEAKTLLVMAAANRSLFRFEPWKECAEQGLVIARQLQDRALEADFLYSLAVHSGETGRVEEALSLYEQSLAIIREIRDRRHEMANLHNIGEAYCKLGRPEKALEYGELALRKSQEFKNRVMEREALLVLATAERDRGNLNRARTLIQEGLQITESLRSQIHSQESRATYLASLHNYNKFSIDLLMRLHKAEPGSGGEALAFEASERMRARVLLEQLIEAGTPIRQGVDPKLIERERSAASQLNARASQRTTMLSGEAKPQELAEIDKTIRALEIELERTQADIRQSSPRYAALTQPPPLTLKEIQQQLDADTLLLEYALGEDRSFLWAISKDSLRSYELPKEEQIVKGARHLHELLSARSTTKGGESALARQQRIAQAETNLPTAAQALSQMLLAPVAAELGAKRLVIVADGALQYIPFAMLPNPMVGKREPLLVNHEVVNLPSVSVLAMQRSELAGRQPAPKLLAVIADPVFDRSDGRFKSPGVTANDKGQTQPVAFNDARRIEHLAEKTAGPPGVTSRRLVIPRLPFTRQEAIRLLALTAKNESLGAMDFQASRANVLTGELSQYRYVHFATHGLLDSDQPGLSSLVLSMVDEQGKPQDGFLRSNEIYNLKLPAELVVLSACQTGLGKEIKGEGLVGMTRGFMYAGAARVVVSLWNVNDKATAELMTKFYEKMLKGGARAAAALRAAQVEMWKQKQWQSPYYWAAFTLQGEWR